MTARARDIRAGSVLSTRAPFRKSVGLWRRPAAPGGTRNPHTCYQHARGLRAPPDHTWPLARQATDFRNGALAMPLLALVFALAAAVLHAFWNLLLAREREVECAAAVALVAAVVAFAPVAALTWRPDSRGGPVLAGSAVFPLVLFAFLAAA